MYAAATHCAGFRAVGRRMSTALDFWKKTIGPADVNETRKLMIVLM